jgi:ferric reductase like protein
VTLWYVTRGSGVVALLLLTAAVVLGVVTALRWRAERWPRFAITDAHRNLTLISIVFVVIHVVTTVADGYAPVSLLDAVIPFVSSYRPLWLGLGTVAFDLLLALVVTSLFRGLVPARAWRALHWTAYAAWPVALVHSLGTGSDAKTAWLQALGIGCLAAVALAVLARLALGGGAVPVRLAGAAAAVVVPVGLLAWYHAGPLQPGWAKRSGTPTAILARKTTPVRASLTSAPVEPRSFRSPVRGSISTSQDASGYATVTISMRLTGGPQGAAKILLRGVPSDGGVSMTASGVTFVPQSTGTVYSGTIDALEGTNVGAVVSDGTGNRLQLHFSLSIDTAGGTVTGTVATA